MREITWPTAALVGVAVALALALLPPVWPALAIGAGAIATAVALGLRGSGRRYFAVAGTAYCLGLAAGYALLAAVPAGHGGSARLALAAVGGASALLLLAWLAAARVAERTLQHAVRSDRLRTRIAALRTATSLLGTLRTLVAVVRVARVGVVAAVGVALVLAAGVGGFAANALGVELPVTVPLLGTVDAVVALYVGAVLAAFHALGMAQTTWIAVRRSVDAGREAGSHVSTTLERAREEPED